MKLQTEKKGDYIAPQIECMEIAVETGYIGSLGSSGNEDYEQEEGTWDD